MKNKLDKPKKYYDIKVECMLPATLTYRVLAQDPEEAITMIKNMSPNHIKHRMQGRKEIKLLVYDAGSTIIRLIKNFFGG